MNSNVYRSSLAVLRQSQSTGLIRCRPSTMSWMPSGSSGHHRTLYTKDALGIDGYAKQRLRTSTQFGGMVDKLRDKMKEFIVPNSKNMIFTEDLKNMAHLIESKP